MRFIVSPSLLPLAGFVGLACISGISLAEPYTGISSFAALSKNFPCAQYLQASKLSPKPAMTVLVGTFGDDWQCVKRFATTFKDKPHAIQAHLTNGPCRRNGRCWKGEIWAKNGLLREGEFRRRTQKVNGILNALANSNTKLVLTTTLEDDLSSSNWLKYRQIVEEYWSHDVVRSPTYAPKPSFGSGLEWHGLYPWCRSGDISNNDGTEVGMSDIRRFERDTRSCAIRFLWMPNPQGVKSRFVVPMARRFTLTVGDLRLWKKFLKSAS